MSAHACARAQNSRSELAPGLRPTRALLQRLIHEGGGRVLLGDDVVFGAADRRGPRDSDLRVERVDIHLVVLIVLPGLQVQADRVRLQGDEAVPAIGRHENAHPPLRREHHGVPLQVRRRLRAEVHDHVPDLAVLAHDNLPVRGAVDAAEHVLVGAGVPGLQHDGLLRRHHLDLLVGAAVVGEGPRADESKGALDPQLLHRPPRGLGRRRAHLAQVCGRHGRGGGRR
mmetsp:Transcript_114583/g.320189  ORF Transcript_114583/g.320189 Transcript_114583/m.320189 type:complete len:227 (-) Transcript_114583:55-735(-)